MLSSGHTYATQTNLVGHAHSDAEERSGETVWKNFEARNAEINICHVTNKLYYKLILTLYMLLIVLNY